MTIYAIVNNLLSTSDSFDSDKPIWSVISPAAILQGGNPFFVPDFADIFEARSALALKIGKLGKGIAPRFVGRYIESAAPAVLFVASDLLFSLKEKGLPWSQAISYDRSLALGKFSDMTLDECKNCKYGFALKESDSDIASTWVGEPQSLYIEETISALSRDNALKMGDIILVGIGRTGSKVSPDMRLTLTLNDSESTAFNIR